MGALRKPANGDDVAQRNGVRAVRTVPRGLRALEVPDFGISSRSCGKQEWSRQETDPHRLPGVNPTMPILARELDQFPDDLLEQQGLGLEADNRWWAVYTKSRHEKELMRRLCGLNIAFYTPLIARRTRSPGGRTRTAYIALFAGYVFLYGNEFDRCRALTTNCVSRCLRVWDGVQLTRDLRHIHRLIELGAPLTPEARLEPGVRVRVRSGPLAGIEGVVIKRAGATRLQIAVNFLQQGASLLLEDIEAERLD